MWNNIFDEKNINIFLDIIFLELEKDNIDISKYELDHICYRVSNKENYELLKQDIPLYGKLLAENIISGRPISTIKLIKPIIYNDRKIEVLEIPSPKIGTDYDDGFEHVEFVIDKSFNEFMEKYSNINFDKSDINREINPDIRIKYEKYSVKFHHNSLEYVVKNF